MSIKESEKDKSDFWVMCKKGMPGKRIPSRGSHKMNLDKKG